MELMNENEKISMKNRAAVSFAYKNVYESMEGHTVGGSINAILAFLNEKERVDAELSLNEQLRFIDEHLHIKNFYVELDKDWNKNVSLPMLVLKTNGEYAVVLPGCDGSAILADTKKKINDRDKLQYEDRALCFYKVFHKQKISKRDLIGFIFKSLSAKELVIILAVSVFTILSGLVVPWANRFIYDKVVPTGNTSQVFPAAALMFSTISVAAIFRILQSFIITNCTLRMNAYVQSGIYDRLLSMKPGFFKNTKSGEISKTVMELSNLSKVFSVRSITAVISMVLSAAYLFQINYYAPNLLGFVILLATVILVLVVAEGYCSIRWQNDYVVSMSSMSGFCFEMFSGMEQIKLNGAEARFFRRWSEHYAQVSQKENMPFLLKYASVLCRFILVLATAVVFLMGKDLTLSEYIAFSAAYGAFISTFMKGGEAVEIITAFRSAYKIAKPIFDGECEDSESEKLKPSEFKGNITVSKLTFSYDDNQRNVINDLSLEIKKGQSIGIAGTSGCGKSTFLRLLLGFERPDSGSIYIDDFDLRELDLKNYRKHLGVVLQNSSLISGDIYANVAMMKPDAGAEEVWRALETAGLKEEVMNLPLGLRTPLSEDNCILSGGQKQRVLIARAVLNKPDILVLDEATSALDNITQEAVMENLNMIECTRIFVAHRLSTLQKCDCIYVFDKGTIAEYGNYDTLMQKKNVFYSLVANQMI